MPLEYNTSNAPQPALAKRTQITILALALALRLFVLCFVIVHSSAAWLYGRGIEMGIVARSIVIGHGFASPFGGDTGPTALIAPGYPFFVAGIFKLFGIYTNTSAIIIMLVQIAANLLAVWLMMRLASKLFNPRAALIAGLFWACWLPLLWVPTIFWETSFSSCMMVGLILFALRLRDRPSTALWITFGIFCGFAVLINMALLITSVTIFLWLASQTWKSNLKNIVLAACLFALIYSPWPIRNARAFHAFVPLRTTVGLELWMGNHDGASGYQDESLYPGYNKQELAAYLNEGEVLYNAKRSAIAHAWIISHPITFAKLTALRFLRFWTGTGMRGGSLIYGLGATFTTLFGFLGLYRLYRSGAFIIAVLFTLPMIVFPLPYYITHAEFRYRIVLDPLMTVLAAYALANFSAKEKRHDKVVPL